MVTCQNVHRAHLVEKQAYVADAWNISGTLTQISKKATNVKKYRPSTNHILPPPPPAMPPASNGPENLHQANDSHNLSSTLLLY